MKKNLRVLGGTGGIVFFTLGIAFFGGSLVLDIDGLQSAGIGLGVIGLIIMLVTGLAKTKTNE